MRRLTMCLKGVYIREIYNTIGEEYMIGGSNSIMKDDICHISNDNFEIIGNGYIIKINQVIWPTPKIHVACYFFNDSCRIRPIFAGNTLFMVDLTTELKKNIFEDNNYVKMFAELNIYKNIPELYFEKQTDCYLHMSDIVLKTMFPFSNKVFV